MSEMCLNKKSKYYLDEIYLLIGLIGSVFILLLAKRYYVYYKVTQCLDEYGKIMTVKNILRVYPVD